LPRTGIGASTGITPSPEISMRAKLYQFLHDDSGPTAVEYAMILALILVVLISAITAVGNSTVGVWTNDVNQITSASS
jgi:pilus assembly protein Flp/PilA